MMLRMRAATWGETALSLGAMAARRRIVNHGNKDLPDKSTEQLKEVVGAGVDDAQFQLSGAAPSLPG